MIESVARQQGSLQDICQDRLFQRIGELAQIGRRNCGGITREGFSAADREARSYLMNEARAAGLVPEVDAAGNILVRLPQVSDVPPGRHDRQILLMGSHLDTVVNGGPLDGAYGVVAALEVLQVIAESGTGQCYEPFVVAFANEEGALFPQPFWGSMALTGRPAPTSGQQEQLRGSLLLAGGDLDAIESAAWPDGSVAAYLELHIEQGPVLERAGRSIGVVDGITGRAVLTVEVCGDAGHAGTSHPILRTSFDLVSYREPVQLVHATAEAPLTVQDLREFGIADQHAAVKAYLAHERRHAFDLRSAPLFRIGVHPLDDKSFQWTVTEHHAIFDGWSLASTLSEIIDAYRQLLAGDEPRPEPLRSRYRDFIAAERSTRQSEESERFWLAKLTERPDCRIPCLTAEYPSDLAADVLTGESHQQMEGVSSTALSQDVCAGLEALAKRADVPLKSVLLAAYLRVISLVTGSSDVLAGLTANGRLEEPDGAEVRGMRVLEAMVADPGAGHREVPLLGAAERALLASWNDNGAEVAATPVHRLFEARAAAAAEAAALVTEAGQVSYRQLNARANRLARYLRGLGVGPDVCVGLYIERSAEMVVGLLGILKAGGAYVPLDAGFPAERLEFMLGEVSAPVVLVHDGTAGRVPAGPWQVINLDSADLPGAGEPGDLPGGRP